ncbi:FTFMHR domain-containing protein [Aspergillus glaucus CBS 516.65]|uniref:C2H2-type domain-containing protein n=1 Tax=Aspergillus glaucus CBS 516.65 TaxID=1160497 RepID=A0A1L9VRF4_ASPGL|nr:hypothetical protein ASPGLDRAFT_121864 [Aspergillus glaucus CBS 516.65]OJJ86471.1 hypothetical protein ASPGLDRAFT_121864 [Aspergillus glaucus CBS 516.65]
MVLKKCTICDRRFKKTEHFKRHERSHTNERPYECNVCHKRFSRSDVLSRHAKGHNPQNAVNGPGRKPSATSDRRPSTITGTSSTIALDENGQQLPHSTPAEGANQFANAPVTPQELPPLSAATVIPPSSLDFLADISTHQHARTESDVNPMMVDNRQAYMSWNGVTPAGQHTHNEAMFGTMPNDIMQLWLEPRGDASSQHGSLDLMQDSNSGLVENNFSLYSDRQYRPSIDTVNSENIPNERFAKVQRFWLAPSNAGRRPVNILWGYVACSDLENIFAMPTVDLLDDHSDRLQGSRYWLDEQCKQRLQAAFGQLPPQVHPNNPLSPTSLDSTLHSLPCFPPAEVLDMALDLYFRNFHPLMPFVHIPTFSAKKTRLPLLYVMCLIGMIMLDTRGTTNFVIKNFPFEHLEQCQMLYVNLLSIAQRDGLFSATEGQILDTSLFESIVDTDTRWKAWSKVESTKRLITGLLTLDSWYSSFLNTSPIIVPDSIQFILPCNEALFQAYNPARWIQLVQSGERILAPTVMTPSEDINLPTFDSPVEDFSMHGILATIQLRISGAYHRLLSNRASYPFAPCHTYAMDGRARCLPSLQLQVASKYGETLEQLNPNAAVMWHNMCMMLTADIQIFHMAAGRAGPDPARQALDDIAAWSQTPAARRACLHAAHVYKAMINRKASDHTTFHTVFSLFSAALVLGLYTFMVPSSPEPSHGTTSIELLDDVDWQKVGTEGFTSFMEPRGSLAVSATDDPAVSFIRNGGTVYIRGIPFQGGYQSARRILLDYAGLLKDTGKWSVRKFSYVLHIMSDVLMDVE